jgi:hypothetical protein
MIAVGLWCGFDHRARRGGEQRLGGWTSIARRRRRRAPRSVARLSGTCCGYFAWRRGVATGRRQCRLAKRSVRASPEARLGVAAS